MNKPDTAKFVKLEAQIKSLQYQIDVLTALIRQRVPAGHYIIPINPVSPHLPLMPDQPKTTC